MAFAAKRHPRGKGFVTTKKTEADPMQGRSKLKRQISMGGTRSFAKDELGFRARIQHHERRNTMQKYYQHEEYMKRMSMEGKKGWHAHRKIDDVNTYVNRDDAIAERTRHEQYFGTYNSDEIAQHNFVMDEEFGGRRGEDGVMDELRGGRPATVTRGGTLSKDDFSAFYEARMEHDRIANARERAVRGKTPEASTKTKAKGRGRLKSKILRAAQRASERGLIGDPQPEAEEEDEAEDFPKPSMGSMDLDPEDNAILAHIESAFPEESQSQATNLISVLESLQSKAAEIGAIELNEHDFSVMAGMAVKLRDMIEVWDVTKELCLDTLRTMSTDKARLKHQLDMLKHKHRKHRSARGSREEALRHTHGSHSERMIRGGGGGNRLQKGMRQKMRRSSTGPPDVGGDNYGDGWHRQHKKHTPVRKKSFSTKDLIYNPAKKGWTSDAIHNVQMNDQSHIMGGHHVKETYNTNRIT